MAFLTIGGAAIPCALGAPEQDSPEPVGDEARTLSGRTRRVIRGWVRSWTVTTIPMPLADAQALALVLQSPEPLRCGGDLIGGTVDCYGSLTALRHQKTADGERAVVEFRLVEAAPSSPVGVLFSARRGLPAGAAFSRGSSAWYTGPDGRIYQAASGVPRIEWYDWDGDGVRETPTLRLEPAATNLLLDSCNLPASGSAWGAATGFSVSPAASIFQGQTAWRHTNDGLASSRNRSQSGGQFGSGPQTAYVIVENVDAAETALNIRDTTAGANVCVGRLSWATGEASVQEGAGTVLARKLANAGPNGGPVYLLAVTATGTPGNNRRIFLYPTGTGQNTDTVIIHHVQLEAGSIATSPIVTTTAAVTRAADALSFALPASLSRPVPMTLYLRFIERGAAFAQAFQADIVEIGSTARPLLQVDNLNDAGRYRMVYSTAVGVDSFSNAPVAVAIGDVVEIAAVLTAAGASRIRLARNGGPEQAGPIGTARGLAATPWPMQTLRLAVRNQSPLDVLDCALVLGEWTIPQLRAFAT